MSGTTNFVHGIPDVCVSIGFAYQSLPVVGVIFNPFTQHLYSAIRGQGAWRTIFNQQLSQALKRDKLPLFVRPLKLNTSVVSVSYRGDRGVVNLDKAMEQSKKLLSADGGMVHGIRRCGSTALDLCEVACGYLDAKKTSNWAWDVCAGWVIVLEAGGFVVSGTLPTTGNETIVLETDIFCRDFLFVRSVRTQAERESFIKDFWRVTKRN